jgi:hypothetical protein
MKTLTVEGRRLSAIGRRQGPSEGVKNCGDRATALLEDIRCQKIRGCSYRRGNTALPYRTMLHRTITQIDRPQ